MKKNEEIVTVIERFGGETKPRVAGYGLSFLIDGNVNLCSTECEVLIHAEFASEILLLDCAEVQKARTGVDRGVDQ